MIGLHIDITYYKIQYVVFASIYIWTVFNYGAAKVAQRDLWWPNFASSLPSKDRQGEREKGGKERGERRRGDDESH
jgi:hypothetical protein